MKLQVSKWGNSLAVRLPAAYARQAGIADGDTLEATMTTGGELRILPVSSGDAEAAWHRIEALVATLPRTESVLETLRREARY